MKIHIAENDGPITRDGHEPNPDASDTLQTWLIVVVVLFTVHWPDLVTAPDPPLTKMELAGSTEVGETTGHPLQSLNNHRRLVARIFAPSDIVGDGREEILHCAASQGMLSDVQALLAEGRFSYDLPDRFGRTPLHWAAEQGYRNVVLTLLRAGACVDPRSERKSTPIMLAASKGHTEVVIVLLHHRAGESDLEPLHRHRSGVGPSRSTALHYAAAGGHVRVVKVLLDAGFDRGQHGAAGLTPAEVSARKSHPASAAVTRLLLPTSDMGGKLIYDHVNMLTEEVVTVSGLVKGGAFLDWQDGIGNTPLHQAALLHHDTVSRILLKAGANPNISDYLGTCPLHVAAFGGRDQMVTDLLEAGADRELLTFWGESPLHRAVMNNRLNVVNLLLKAGASTEHRDDTLGQTPLSWACKGCLAHIVRVLVEAGADVESRSSAGLTPLHWACRFIDAESVEVLVAAGADPGAVDLAAADYALETSSSSRRGKSDSRPVAVDVIGLGYPPDLTGDSGLPFTGGSVTLATRRLDLVSVRRIKSALKRAKLERSWCRRGWLVILASRYVAINSFGVREEPWTVCHDGSSPVLPDLVNALTNSDTPDSHHLREETTDAQPVSSRLRSADKAVEIARAASRQQAHTRGEIGAQEKVGAVLDPKIVGALLELATVEVGVFRRVVIFI